MDLSINVNGLFPAHAQTNGVAESASASRGNSSEFSLLALTICGLGIKLRSLP